MRTCGPNILFCKQIYNRYGLAWRHTVFGVSNDYVEIVSCSCMCAQEDVRFRWMDGWIQQTTALIQSLQNVRRFFVRLGNSFKVLIPVLR